jgi:hypothetical protein
MRDDKFAWRQEYDEIRVLENSLGLDLTSWLERHDDWAFPTEAPTSGNGLLRSTLELTRVRELLEEAQSWGAERKVEQQRCLGPVLAARAQVGALRRERRGQATAEAQAAEALAAASAALHAVGLKLDAECSELEGSTSAAALVKGAEEEEEGGWESGEGAARPVSAPLAGVQDSSDAASGARAVSAGGGLRAARAVRGAAAAPLSEAASEGLVPLGVALDRVGGAQSADTAVRESLLAALEAAHARASAAVAAEAAAWVAASASLGVEDSGDACGGWTEAAHTAYVHAVKLHARLSALRAGQPAPPPTQTGGSAHPVLNSSTGLGSDLSMTVQLLLRVGGVTGGPANRASVTAHHEWALARRAHEMSRSALAQQWATDRSGMLEAAARKFASVAAAAEASAQTVAARAMHEKVRAATHVRLELAQSRKAVADAIEAALSSELADAEAAVESLARQERQAGMDARKAAVAAYKAAERDAEAQLNALRSAMAAEEKARLREEVEVGAGRVQVRAAATTAARAARTAEREAQVAAVEAARTEALDRLIASVPYAARMGEIASTADGERVRSHTASFAAASELSLAYAAYLRAVQGGGPPADGEGGENAIPGATSHGGMDVALAAKGLAAGDPRSLRTRKALLDIANTRIKEQGLFGQQGFSDKQVTGDKRWRFVAALRVAGVAAPDGSAARTALGALNAGYRGGATANILHAGGNLS